MIASMSRKMEAGTALQHNDGEVRGYIVSVPGQRTGVFQRKRGSYAIFKELKVTFCRNVPNMKLATINRSRSYV